MYKWNIECSINGKIRVREVFDEKDEKEAKDEYACVCYDTSLCHGMPGPGMENTLYDLIELYKQDTVTGEILERKVRTFK